MIMGSYKNTNKRHCEGFSPEAISILIGVTRDCFVPRNDENLIFGTAIICISN